MKIILSTRDSMGKIELEGVVYYWFEHNNILGLRFSNDTFRLYPLTNIWYIEFTLDDLKDCKIVKKEK